MKISLVLCFTIFLVYSANSQDDFIPGYIIKKGKDTIKGFIKKDIEVELSKKITFREHLNDPAKIFMPGEIESFGIYENIYKSQAFLNTALDSPANQIAFCKQLVYGRYELYTILIGENRYYIVMDGPSVLFLWDGIFTNKGEVVKEGNYLSRMRLYLNECPEVSHRYQNLDYDQKSVTNYIASLDNCLAPASAKTYYHKTKTQTNVCVSAGALPMGQYGIFSAQALLQFSSPELSRKTTLNIGIHYTNMTTSISYAEAGNVNIPGDITNSIISLPLTIQYDFLTGRIRPYVYGGFSVLYRDPKTTDPGAVGSPFEKGFGFSVVGGLGFQVKIVGNLFGAADFRYEYYLQYPTIGIGYLF